MGVKAMTITKSARQANVSIQVFREWICGSKALYLNCFPLALDVEYIFVILICALLYDMMIWSLSQSLLFQ